MQIDWSALGTVTIVALVATTLLVALFATGVRALSRREQALEAGNAGIAATATAGSAFVLCGGVVLFGIYLVVLG